MARPKLDRYYGTACIVADAGSGGPYQGKQYMKRRIFDIAAILLLLTLGFGQDKPVKQPFDTGKLDDLFDRLEGNNKMMGIVTISKDGKEIYSRALGYSRI